MLVDFPLRIDGGSIFEGNCLYLQPADRTRQGLSAGTVESSQFLEIKYLTKRAEQQDTITYLTPLCWSVAPNQEKLPRHQAFQTEEHSRSSVFLGKC